MIGRVFGSISFPVALTEYYDQLQHINNTLERPKEERISILSILLQPVFQYWKQQADDDADNQSVGLIWMNMLMSMPRLRMVTPL